MNICVIGTRDLTLEQTAALANKGSALSKEGHYLLSGNAPGADQAWVSLLDPMAYTLYLPWDSFERASRPTGTPYSVSNDDAKAATHPYWEEYAEITKKQPWGKLKAGTQALQARNWLMVEDSDMVYAAPSWSWTNDLQTPIGGTAFGIFLAHKLGKPYNILQWLDFYYIVWSHDTHGALVDRYNL